MDNSVFSLHGGLLCWEHLISKHSPLVLRYLFSPFKRSLFPFPYQSVYCTHSTNNVLMASLFSLVSNPVLSLCLIVSNH